LFDAQFIGVVFFFFLSYLSAVCVSLTRAKGCALNHEQSGSRCGGGPTAKKMHLYPVEALADIQK
jgi:hypothetical protein